MDGTNGLLNMLSELMVFMCRVWVIMFNRNLGSKKYYRVCMIRVHTKYCFIQNARLKDLWDSHLEVFCKRVLDYLCPIASFLIKN